jgi:Holliday junction resolvase RusA-like endonuclease
MAGRELLTGPVSVRLSIDLTVPTSWSQKKQRDAIDARVLPTTKPDCDNTIKAVFDGLNGVAWRDDVQVVDLTVSKRYAKIPGVLVSIRSVQQPAPQDFRQSVALLASFGRVR